MSASRLVSSHRNLEHDISGLVVDLDASGVPAIDRGATTGADVEQGLRFQHDMGSFVRMARF